MPWTEEPGGLQPMGHRVRHERSVLALYSKIWPSTWKGAVDTFWCFEPEPGCWHEGLFSALELDPLFSCAGFTCPTLGTQAWLWEHPKPLWEGNPKWASGSQLHLGGLSQAGLIPTWCPVPELGPSHRLGPSNPPSWTEKNNNLFGYLCRNKRHG